MDVLHERAPEDSDTKDKARIGNMLVSAARVGINTQLRVDEQKMRERRDDLLPRILERLALEKAKLGMLIEG